MWHILTNDLRALAESVATDSDRSPRDTPGLFADCTHSIARGQLVFKIYSSFVTVLFYARDAVLAHYYLWPGVCLSVCHMSESY